MGRSWLRRHPELVLLALALFALVEGVSPLLHHDLDCHLKTPTHCGACTQGPGASRLEASVSLERPLLAELGRIELGPITMSAPGATQERTGRAPPV
jgi:hypothetical protein